MLFEMTDDLKGFFAARAAKIQERKAYIAEHPEAVIKVDPEALHDVLEVDYLMKCAQACSVAGDRAIKGSDIDGGAIITAHEVPVEKQHAVIEYLKEAGFEVYHPDESARAEKALKELPWSLSRDRQKLVDISSKNVSFVTTRQVEAHTVPDSLSTVYNGAIIARHGDIGVKRK